MKVVCTVTRERGDGKRAFGRRWTVQLLIWKRALEYEVGQGLILLTELKCRTIVIFGGPQGAPTNRMPLFSCVKVLI